MSFLQQIQRQRSILKPTTTTITIADGKKFIENRQNILQPVKLEENCYGFVVDAKPDTVAACILEHFLYIGSQDAVSIENISSHDITHVLSIGVEMPKNVLFSHIKNKFIKCLDLPETILFKGILQDAIEFIISARDTNGRVLVHCNAGVSRSASIVIGYLMIQMGLSFDSAYALLKSKRECIQPNNGFIQQLQNYANTNASNTNQ